MPVRLVKIDSSAPDPAEIAAAARVIAAGGLVIFPTETVYGLGANALDSEAVRAIFRAKGRPSINPVIVHVAHPADAAALLTEWPTKAQRLAERFWPGPLTLVLTRKPAVPNAVTAGGATVGVRVPAHPVARALLEAFGGPIAAPSANPSNRVSATDVGQLDPGLLERVDLVLDAGPTPGGIESTVLDLTIEPPRVLRLGLVSVTQLRTVVPEVRYEHLSHAAAGPLRAPGTLPRHYAPLARLELHTRENAPARIRALVAAGLKVGWMALGSVDHPDPAATLMRHEMPHDPTAYAHHLFRTLHELDAAGVAVIVAELPPDADAWLAIRDRLRRAATPMSE